MRYDLYALGLTVAQLQALSSLRIRTIDQFIARVQERDERAGMARYLGISNDELDRIVQTAQELTGFVPTPRAVGFGALPKKVK